MGRSIFSEPRIVKSLDDCFFYHVMDLPGGGTVGEQWDLRATIDDYLGHVELRNKRVLDVGAASGFLTFEMEKRGATVVSFDLGEDCDWDVVPFAGFDLEEAKRAKRASRERLLNAYWFAHRALGSTAQAFYGNIYDLPEELGQFDIVVMGSILLHLRDPFWALRSASRLSRDTLLITDLHYAAPTPVMEFLPDYKQGNADTWWRISEACMSRMITTLGFGEPVITRADHAAVLGGRRLIRLSTYVARRPSHS